MSSQQQQNVPDVGEKVTYHPIGGGSDNTSTSTGTVTEILTEPTFVGTGTVKASESEPRVVIENANTGKETAYKTQNIVGSAEGQ